jgi:uncharacterized membrane protein
MITLMVARMHVALTLRLKLKKYGKTSVGIARLWFHIYVIIFGIFLEKYMIVLLKKKCLKTSKISSSTLDSIF